MPRFFVVALVLLAGCEATPTDAPAVAPEVDGGWQVHLAEAEAGEDHPGSVLLTRRAEAGEPGAAFRPRLVLGCEEGVTEAYVEWGVPLGRGPRPVSVRLDGVPEAPRPWTVSGDGEATGLWGDSTSVPFLRTLLGHDRLALRVTPEGAPPLAGTFALAGLDSLMAQVRALCPWE